MNFVLKSNNNRLIEILFNNLNITVNAREMPIIHTEQSCNCNVCTVHKTYSIELNTMLDIDKFFDCLDKHIRRNEVTLTRVTVDNKKVFWITLNEEAI